MYLITWSTKINSTNKTASAHDFIMEMFCCCCAISCRLAREHDLTISPASGITGRLSQLHTSIMNPSGSWKNSCSTFIPPSSTIARTQSSPISFSFFSTAPMFSHCTFNIFHVNEGLFKWERKERKPERGYVRCYDIIYRTWKADK